MRSTAWIVSPSIAFFGAFAFGTTATEKPSLAASRSRSWPRGAGRTSPARPTSPNAMKPRGSGLPRSELVDRQQHRQVGRGLADAHAADRVDEHVLVHAGDAGMAVQHRQQHRQPVALEARPTGGAGSARRESTSAWISTSSGRVPSSVTSTHAARHRLAVRRQEDRARVRHALQPALGHREHADLVDRAEAVLDRAHQAEARMRVALEVQHRVDHVLEHARAGERAFLGDVADQHDRSCRWPWRRASAARRTRAPAPPSRAPR